MKKKMIYIFLLLAAVLIGIYIVRYKTGPCVCDTIPKEADAAILVNARNMERHFLHDMLSNPMSYIGTESNMEKDTISVTNDIDNEEDTPSIMRCISIPKAMIFYRMGSDNQWYSAKIKIKDEKGLAAILDKSDFEAQDSNGAKAYRKGKQSILINDGMIQMAYSLGAADDLSTIETGYITKGDVLFDVVSDSSSDIIYADRSGQVLNLNFEDGAIRVDGNYKVDMLKPSAQKVSSSGVGQFSADLDVNKMISQIGMDQVSKFTNFTKLSMDSIGQYWDGKINMTLNGFETISDTIKTYEYDDDFNKIEVKKINQNVMPDYNILLGLSSNGMDYMKRKNAIQKQNDQDVLAIMPLVKTYCAGNEKSTNFYTSKSDIDLEKSSDKLIFKIDLQKSDSKDLSGLLPMGDVLKNIEYLDMKISNDDVVTMEVSVDGSRNAFVSLLKGK